MPRLAVPAARRRARWAAALAALVVSAAGCASTGGTGDAPPVGTGDAPLGGDATAAGAADTRGGVVAIDAEAAVALLADREDVTVIDVRTPEEHAAGHLDGAVLLDLAGGRFDAEVGDLDRDASYVLYCRTGSRSADAAATMDELGFADVSDAGGYDDLVAAGADVAP